MVEIPKELARAIQAGDCVLWVGAGIGALTGRPGWDVLLKRIVATCPESEQDSLHALLEQGRLRTVMTFVHRHFGDESLAQMLKQVSSEATPSDARDTRVLRELPWRACLATIYADAVAESFSIDGAKAPELLAHNMVHHLSLRDADELFVLKTPPTGRATRANSVLYDFVEEIVRTRTILFLGFQPNDPDLEQILDLLGRIGLGNRHYALTPSLSTAEAEEWSDRYGIQVLPIPDQATMGATLDALEHATEEVAVRPSDVAGELAILDLVRSVRGVHIRADLSVDVALTLDVAWIEHLLDALPGGSMAGVPQQALLSAGCVLLAYGRIPRARRCFQEVVRQVAGGEATHVARFNLALCSAAEGDHSAALEGLSEPGERSLALVPPRFELLGVRDRYGAELLLHCRDRESQAELDIAVSTLGRPVGGDEQAAFNIAVQALVGIEHASVCHVRGGFADGRIFGVMYDYTPGFVLADVLEPEPMETAKALEFLLPLGDGLAHCHTHGVFHRNINPQTALMGTNGGMLRGFGLPPIIGFTRPSVRRENLGYFAPETRSGGVDGAQADTYAFAALAYRCLTGRIPTGSVPALSSFNPDVDPRLDEALRGALHPIPEQRTGLGKLQEALRHIADTPGQGEALKASHEGTEPGVETVVDVGHPPVASAPVPAPATTLAFPTPEDPNDLDAWSSILEQKSTHLEAWQALDRIEHEARQVSRWDRLVDVLRVKAVRAQRRNDPRNVPARGDQALRARAWRAKRRFRCLAPPDRGGRGL